MKILVIEDSDSKYQAISSVILSTGKTESVQRAATVLEAEREVAKRGWNLIVLDISLDIAPSRLGPRSRGQANLGGLGIAQRMFLLQQEAPTVILTAFDSFSTPTVGPGAAEIVGFDEVKIRAEKFLSQSLRGTLQYNSPSWRESLRDIVLSEINS